MSAPEVAVVVPTHRRETRLRFALEALAAQTLARDRFEVVVVRSPAAEGPFAEAPDGLAARFLAATATGPGQQRNAGWRATRAPLVAFTDDDCRPAPDWLASLLDAADGESIIQGQTRPDPDEVHLLGGLSRTIEVEGPSPWYPSCNIAYPRGLLEQLGGFDEAFGLPHWGEDTDLGMRARDAGAPLRYVEVAIVHHGVVSRLLPAALADASRRRWLALLVSRHPELRKALYAGWFVNRGHASLAVALAGGALIGRSRGPALAALAAAPYLAHNLGYHLARRPASPRTIARFGLQLPGRLAIDFAELVAVLRGSIEHRSLVL